jgi:hypothetical protein
MINTKRIVLRSLCEFVVNFATGCLLGTLLKSIGVPVFWDDGSFNPFAGVAIACVGILIAMGDWTYPHDREYLYGVKEEA